MFTRVSSLMVALAFVAFAVGCSEAPQTEITNAETALQTAMTAEAEQYAPDSYRMAMDSMNAAKAELQVQEGKFSLFRSYDRTSQLLASTSNLAQKAQTDAAAEKERVRVNDSTMIDQITVLIATTQTALASAPKGKGSKADIEMIKADLTTAQTAFGDAIADYQAGKLLAAQSKLTAVQAQVGKINDDIAAAKAKVSGK